MQIKKLLILFLILHTSFSFSQAIFSSANLSSFKASSVSDQDIEKAKMEMSKRNLTIANVETMALAKGMPASEIAILKERLTKTPGQPTLTPPSPVSVVSVDTITPPVLEVNPTPIEVPVQKPNKNIIFGSEIFSNPALSFEPNSSLATPSNYILGSMDELQIVIYGVQQYSEKVKIDKEGKITLANIGQLNLAGQSFSAAEMLIKNAAGRIYNTLRTGESNLSISLTNIKSIKVTIIGAKTPGNYSLSSLSTVFNALHMAGGPNENGSYRKIELVRDSKVVKVIDIYRFLMTGDQKDNVNLQDNDVIRIPVYEKRVQVEGKVKQQGLFELTATETFNDLLKYCSGFEETAFKGSIKLIQNTEKELKVIDLSPKEFATYIPKTGDAFKISEILNRFENRVTINGAVYRPDVYAISEGMTIKDVIEKAEGLTPDAFLDRAKLVRERDDLEKEIIGINLNNVMKGDPASNIVLKKEDELFIHSKQDFQQFFDISIFGEIKNPGDYRYIANGTLYDLIIQAGGFLESADKKIEISRLIKNDSKLKDSTRYSEIINIDFSGDFKNQTNNIVLSPNDVIQVRKIPGYDKPKVVNVKGKAVYPGQYSISGKEEKVLDIIQRAGGLDIDANPEGIKIIRNLDNIETKVVESIDIVIPINYKQIRRRPKSIKNIRVRDGDQIIVEKKAETIKVVGAVSLVSEIPQKGKRGVRYYINSVGGLSEDANKKNIYVVYANGMAKHMHSFLFFKTYPSVEAGAQIVVPKRAEDVDKLSLTEKLGIASVVSSMAAVAIAVIRVLNP